MRAMQAEVATLKKERDRIYRAGSTVNFEGRIDGNLNLSRAIGDLPYKRVRRAVLARAHARRAVARRVRKAVTRGRRWQLARLAGFARGDLHALGALGALGQVLVDGQGHE